MFVPVQIRKKSVNAPAPRRSIRVTLVAWRPSAASTAVRTSSGIGAGSSTARCASVFAMQASRRREWGVQAVSADMRGHGGRHVGAALLSSKDTFTDVGRGDVWRVALDEPYSTGIGRETGHLADTW